MTYIANGYSIVSKSSTDWACLVTLHIPRDMNSCVLLGDRTTLRQRTILRQSRDSHVEKCNPCMIHRRDGKCLEYSYS